MPRKYTRPVRCALCGAWWTPWARWMRKDRGLCSWCFWKVQEHPALFKNGAAPSEPTKETER